MVTPFVCSWGKFQVSRHPIALSGDPRASVQIVSVVTPGNGSGKLSSTSGERKAIQAAVESYYALPGVPDDESLERSQSHIFSSCFLRFVALILEPVRRYVHTKSIKIWDKEKLCRYMYFMDVLCSLLSVRSSCWKIAGFKVWVSGSPRFLQQEWRDDSWQSTELGPARILAKATLKETSVFCAHASGNIRAMALWKYYCRKAQRPSGNSRNLYCILSKYFRAALVVWLIPGVSLPRRSMDLCPPGNNS